MSTEQTSADKTIPDFLHSQQGDKCPVWGLMSSLRNLSLEEINYLGREALQLA